MKGKNIVFTVVAVAGMTLGAAAFAADAKTAETADVHGSSAKMCKTCELHGKGDVEMSPMMKPMQRQAVATSDGGIVIVSCNKIMKYDKDLKLVNEVDVPCAMMDEMKGMAPMHGMDKSKASAGMKKCPMMGGMPESEPAKK